MKDKGMPILLVTMVSMAVGLLAFVEKYPFPADVDAHNLESGVKNAYTMIGSLSGVAVVYFVEKKYIQFSEKAVWWAQILKAVGGIALVLCVKEGMRAPLELIFQSELLARGIRYFLIVIAGGVIWPLTFPWFSKLGKK